MAHRHRAVAGAYEGGTADGAPTAIQFDSGAISLFYRAGQSVLITTSWDNAATWATPAPLPLVAGTANQGRYAAMFRMSANQVSLVYGMAYTAPVANSVIMFGFLAAGFGTTALGSPIPEPKNTSVALNPEVPPYQTGWSFVPTGNLGGGSIASDGVSGRTLNYTMRLQKGTYTFYFIHSRAATHGIAVWTLDGAALATYDEYNTSAALNIDESDPGIVVAQSGLHAVSGIWNTHNASATTSFFVGTPQGIIAVRTDGAS